MSFKYTSISMTLSIKGRQTIWLIFGRSVNPIPTGGEADYPQLLLLAPPKFFTFRHHCIKADAMNLRLG